MRFEINFVKTYMLACIYALEYFIAKKISFYKKCGLINYKNSNKTALITQFSSTVDFVTKA